MKKNLILLVFSALFAVACATERGPASVEQKKTQEHQQYQGLFNSPTY
jgi:PBP1b-binding outer membrane lipoprotein LpoB